MPSLIFNSALDDAARGNIDFDSDTFYVVLNTGYSPDKDAHTKRSDLTGEVSGAGYSAGGAAVTVGVTKDLATDRVNISLGGNVWSNATISATGATYYKRRGGAASADELIAHVDFGQTVSSTNGDFTLTASTIRLQN